MKKSLVAVLPEYDASTPIADLARRHGIHANTVRLWKSKNSGFVVSDLLDSSNSKMKIRECAA